MFTIKNKTVQSIRENTGHDRSETSTSFETYYMVIKNGQIMKEFSTESEAIYFINKKTEIGKEMINDIKLIGKEINLLRKKIDQLILKQSKSQNQLYSKIID